MRGKYLLRGGVGGLSLRYMSYSSVPGTKDPVATDSSFEDIEEIMMRNEIERLTR
jgi:hypothetical protein